MSNVDLSYVIGLPPEKAVKYFEEKGYRLSWDWQDTWQEAHAKAFTVAKAMRMDVLQDIRDSVQNALKNGLTFEQFKKELMPKLQAKGWWGRKLVGDETGAKEVQLGSPYRLRTIYNQNLQSSYMAGRWQAQTEDKSRPYLQYVAVMDARTRPAHAAMNGLVFPIGDAFWDSFYPPNGWNCRCRTRAFSKDDLESKRLSAGSSEGRLSQREIYDPDGVVRSQSVYQDGLTGEKISPDPGFSNNPGKAAWQPSLDKYDYDVAKQYIEGAVTGPDFKRFFQGETGGDFPIAALDPEHMKTIGAKSQTVYLSGETMAKNLKNHPELSLKEYQKLPGIISSGAQVILQQGDRKLIFVKVDGRYYNAVLKAAKSGEPLFLLSLRRVDDVRRDVGRLVRQGDVKVIKNEL